MTKAILDLGTNTFHLLVAKLVNGELLVLAEVKESVKVGEQGMMAGMITEQALQRAIAALLKFKTTIASFDLEAPVAVIATSAFRNARNAEQVCAQIKSQTGFDVTIISGDQEAQLIYEGVKLSGAIQDHTSMIVDIGGGSVEFIICNQEGILWKQSVDIGGLRLIEKFHKSDPILSIEISNIINHFHDELSDLHLAVDTYQPKVLLGSSGAFDTYLDIHCAKNKLPIPTAHANVLPLDSYLAIHADLMKKTSAERLAIPGMIPLRVEMIVVASCLTKYLIDTYQFKKIITSRYALKEGAMLGV